MSEEPGELDERARVDPAREARDHAVRRQLEDEQRELVAAEGVRTYELPRLPGGIDPGALVELAGLLRHQGLA